MSGQLIRNKFMRRFVGLEKHSRLVASAVVASYVLQIVLLIWVGHYLLTASVTSLGIVFMGLVAVLIGTRLRGLNNIVHECSHAAFAKDRQDNVILGSLAASIVLGCFRDYRNEHLSHHAHLGDYEKDMDLHGIEGLSIHESLTLRVLLRHLTNPLWGRHLPYYLSVNLSDGDGSFFKWFKVTLIAAVIVFLLLDPLTVTLFVLVPYVLIYTTINYWTDCLDHAGLVAADDELDASRNVLAPYLVRIVFFPRNDCFHLVHHLFPQVPARHLGAVHEELVAELIYRKTRNAVGRSRSSAIGDLTSVS